MSLIGIWELHATPSWRDPPLESLILWYWWELGAACYAFVQEPLPKSLSLYVCPLGVHHSSHMPLGRVYSVFGLWGRLLVCHFYGFSRLVYGKKLYTAVSGAYDMRHGFILWNIITWFYGYHLFMIRIFIYMVFKYNVY